MATRLHIISGTFLEGLDIDRDYSVFADIVFLNQSATDFESVSQSEHGVLEYHPKERMIPATLRSGREMTVVQHQEHQFSSWWLRPAWD